MGDKHSLSPAELGATAEGNAGRDAALQQGGSALCSPASAACPGGGKSFCFLEVNPSMGQERLLVPPVLMVQCPGCAKGGGRGEGGRWGFPPLLLTSPGEGTGFYKAPRCGWWLSLPC